MHTTTQEQEATLKALAREVQAEKDYLKVLKGKLEDTLDEKATAWAENEIKEHEKILTKAQECLSEAAGDARVRGNLQQKRGPGRPRKNDADPED